MHRLMLEFQQEQATRLCRLELKSCPSPPVAITTSPASVLAATLTASASPSGTSATNISPTLAALELLLESQAKAFFQTFEHLPVMLNWPKQDRPTLLQCKLTGKAQNTVASLPLVDSLDYELCKAAVLRAYEMVSEAYRQQYRIFKKGPFKPLLSLPEK